MKIKEIILRTFAFLFIIGGVIRIFATQSTFYKLRIGYFWVQDDYFIFVNRIMGGIVLLTGILFLGVAKDMVRFRYILGHFALGLFFLILIIGISGYLLGFPIYSFIADVILFGIISIFCLYIRA
jgi:hypothetical protein